MSVINDMEDEDVILKNSPLYQYLNEIDSENVISDEVIQNFVHNEMTNQFQLIILENFSYFINYIKKCSFNRNLEFILNEARNVNILDEEDDIFLNYLVDTRTIQLNRISYKFTFISKPLLVLIFAIFVSLIMVFEKLIIVSVIFSLLFLWVVFLLMYCYTIKKLTVKYFDQIVTLSRQSRQIILMIQELLSINQGYTRMVHIIEDEHYDSSKSFNVQFSQEFCKRVFNILSDVFKHTQNWNENFQNLNTKHLVSCPSEVPWLKEMTMPSLYDDIEEFDFKHPMNDLKTIHNLIQLQFCQSIKRIVLFMYSLHCHPSIGMVYLLINVSYKCVKFIADLNNCTKVLEYRTKRNLSHDKISNTTKLRESNIKNNFLLNNVRSMELHLFEISEFTSQFRDALESNQVHDETFVTYVNALNKCRIHISAIGTCCDTMFGELQDVSAEKSTGTPCVLRTTREDTDANNEVICPNEEVEIMDEVLEGLPVGNDPINGDNKLYGDLDTFAEKSKRNANSLLNELKSVIEVRAEEWKKREKAALERRAAEGKFVFPENDDGGDVNNSVCKDEKNNDEDHSIGMADDNSVGIDADERSSFSDLILRQRQMFLLDSDINFGDEECFGD